ncbi:CaiB/BaiF CoA transferase family protein [Devosia sp. LjRoot3]|uniref:CaiB/BaiF CoA transferase family protein n=1 Tax=Devosia sp. LjRoot3 TaxID=3342319 RepID=UPI003ECF193D
MADLPLLGVKVLDLSRVLAGPLSAMVLGDLGADVIKVERPGRGDDTRDWGLPLAAGDTTYFYGFNRNKRSITLDLASESDRQSLLQLVKEADVLVENFKAGDMERFGLGYDHLSTINPRLIYCAVAGYDRQGPEAARPGYDLVIQGESGLMSINGEADGPPLKLGIAAVDLFTGMSAAQAMLAALFQAQRTGKGRRVDVALHDHGIALSSYYGLEALLRQADPPRVGSAHPSIVPYGVFEAADGPLVITVGNNEQYRNFCLKVLKRPDLADDPRFATNVQRAANRAVLLAALEPEIARHQRADLLPALAQAGIPAGEVKGLHEALSGARTQQSGMVGSYEHPAGEPVSVLSSPWRFDGERLPVRRPPTLGEHNADLLHPDGAFSK